MQKCHRLILANICDSCANQNGREWNVVEIRGIIIWSTDGIKALLDLDIFLSDLHFIARPLYLSWWNGQEHFEGGRAGLDAVI